MAKHTALAQKQKSALFDQLVLAVAIIEPLSTLPQIIETYSTHNVESLSLLSWLLYIAASLIWLVYSIKIRNIPLIASSIMWVSAELVLIVGILMYS